MNIMIFRLFKTPLHFISLAFILSFFFGYYVPETLSKSLMFSMLVEQSKNITPYVFLGLMSVSMLTAISSGFRLWRWTQAKGDSCYNCGGIAEFRHGRYGYYYKCLACGKGRKV